MIKVVVIGIGKMGISHLAITAAHPAVEIVGVADSSAFVINILKKYTEFDVFTDFKKMVRETHPDAAIVSVPTKLHEEMVEFLLQHHIHVFVEKPFCMDIQKGLALQKLAKEKALINQVGYHNKFVGTFEETKKIIEGGYIGPIHHFDASSYGPVVTKKNQQNWRNNPVEGGGCLMDYASHVIDLIHYLIGPIKKVQGALLESIYSQAVEDAVYTLLRTENDIPGTLSVSWSDETFRKMSTGITVIGSKGKIIADATEVQVYFKTNDCPNGYTKGWNQKNITEVTAPVQFYLRGEEYSAQIDYFIESIQTNRTKLTNSFEEAIKTDAVIQEIKTFQFN